MGMIDADIIIIGSGIGGLCCGALLARYGLSVIVCESHSIPGGAAHGFERNGFQFDSGPSLYSGLSYPSANPLRHVLEAIAAEIDWATYDTWRCCLPEGEFDTAVGADQFCEVLTTLRGQEAVQEWRQLQRVMEPLKEAAIAIPSAAVRLDWGAVTTLGHYLPNLLPHTLNAFKLAGPFSTVMNGVVHDPFIRNWLDLLCFLLSGLPASGTSAAEVAFMFAEWYRPGVTLEYPMGGSGALVNALVRGLEAQGGQLKLRSHVDRILVEGDRAIGIQLRNGEQLRAGQAVISNASVWDTLKLVPKNAFPTTFRTQRQATPYCDSFMHLHLGISAAGLPPDLACHAIVVNDWNQGITAPQNVVLISIPSVLDPSLAPPGKHTIHVYTPGNEPYQLWKDLSRQSDAYQSLKDERSRPMWEALRRVIPDIGDRCELIMVGTPLTHERFLRRDRGSYGPAIRAGQGLFPGAKTPLKGLLCCGDSTFPGIGLPAVAASGMIAAHSLVPVPEQVRLLQALHLW